MILPVAVGGVTIILRNNILEQNNCTLDEQLDKLVYICTKR